MNFNQLHLHTYFSVLDGIPSPEEYVKEAKEVGMKSLAITDHGNMSGVFRFSNACKKEKIKGIIGCEFYINNRRDEIIPKGEKNPNNHIVLLAKNKIGYKNLLKINYDSFKNGFYYRGRTTEDVIFSNTKGLICLTACMGGPIAKWILKGDMREAERTFLRYKKYFKDDLYGELHFNELENQALVTKTIYKLCKKWHVQFVITGDCHYIKEEDAELQDYLLMINTKKRVTDENIFRFETRKLYFHKSKDYHIFNEKFGYNFPKSVIEKGLKNTLKIADKCNFMLSDEKIKLPTIKDKYGHKVFSDSVLYTKCVRGLKKLCKSNGHLNCRLYSIRLNKELEVINEKEFSDYFLIVEDIINFCKREDIGVGVGRGSSAGSLVAYLLGITKVDPIRFNLSFERFLNRERDNPPDIDLDFESEKREKIEKYLKEKYGEDNVVHIITFSTFRVKGALRDMARVLEKEKDEDFNTIIKKIEDEPSSDIYYLKNQIKDKEWTVSEKNFIRENKVIFRIADRLIGGIRQYSLHAGGIVITPESVYNYIPINRVKGNIVAGFQDGPNNRELSQLGIMKIDILGLDHISILEDACRMVEDDTGEKINLSNVDLYIKDKELYKTLSEEYTMGIFQFEARGIDSFLKRVKPSTFEDVVAINAIYRPANVNAKEHERYIKRRERLIKRGKKFSENYKVNKIFGRIVDVTYGTVAYQEQFIDILNQVGGLSLEQADKARKIFKDLYLTNQSTEKKKEDVELVKVLNQFKRGAKENTDMTDEEVDNLIKKLAEFAEYSFNRSHAVSYSLIAMQTLYMREYYSLYYYTALLNKTENKLIEKDFKKLNKMEMYVQFIRKRMKQENKEWDFKRIDMQKSTNQFYIEGDSIRIPFTLIGGIGNSLALELMRMRPFDLFTDFCMKGLDVRINKTAILNLIDIGAFDFLKKKRKVLHIVYEKWLKVKSKYKGKKKEEIKEVLTKYWKEFKGDDYSDDELGELEREICKFNIFQTDDEEILAKIRYLKRKKKIVSVNKNPTYNQYYCVKIMSIKEHTDSNNKVMCFCNVKDFNGDEAEMVIFSNIYKKYRNSLRLREYYVIQGYKKDGIKILVGAKRRSEIKTNCIRLLKNLLNN